MTVATISLPNFTTQDATTYKTSIDSSLSAHNTVAGALAPSALPTPAMAIMVQPAIMANGIVIPAQTVGGIGAPSANKRIDRIYLDMPSRSIQRMVGQEASSPVAPSLPLTAFPIAQIELSVGDTAIVNTAIIDERPLMTMNACLFDGQGYTVVLGPDAYGRMYISNNKVTFVLPDDGIEFQSAKGATLAKLDSVGNLSIAGKVTENATF